MKPISMLVGGALVVAACGDTTTEFVQPLTPCEQFCLDFSARVAGETATRLAENAQTASCATDGSALAECTLNCVDVAPPQACLDCRAASRSGCQSDCTGVSGLRAEALVAQGLSCWMGDARPSNVCSDGPPATVRGKLNDSPFPAEIAFTGTATITSLAPLQLALSTGNSVVIESPAIMPGLAVGDVITVDLEAVCGSFRCESAYVIRNTSGALLQAGWTGRKPLPITEFSLDYAAAECAGSIREHFAAIELALLVDGSRVASGNSVTSQGFRVHNGDSYDRYAAWLSDTPPIWYEGLIEPL